MVSKTKEIKALARNLFIHNEKWSAVQCIEYAEDFMRDFEEWRAERLKEPKLPPLAAEALREFVAWLSLVQLSKREGKEYVLRCEQSWVDSHLEKWRAAAKEFGVEVCGGDAAEELAIDG